MTSAPISPDFDSVVTEWVTLPFRAAPYLKITFSDPLLAGHSIIVVEDSLPLEAELDRGPHGLGLDPRRLTTVIARFPRPILAELNTHRVFSRNSASSRARSVKATIAEVMNAPYIPAWTINRAGMSGEYASEAVAAEATRLHLKGRDAAVATALSLLVGERIFDDRTVEEIARDYEVILDDYYENIYDKTGAESAEGLSIHKQSLNRGLEPYLFHEAIVTSSYWDNFLALRDHDEADPAIHATGRLMREALRVSEPVHTWLHLPFVEIGELTPTSPFSELEPLLFLSATECAQISYKDKSSASTSTATTSLGRRLLAMKHLSPFEHAAFSADEYLADLAFTESSLPTEEHQLSSNFDKSWIQLRPVLSTSDQYKK